MIVDVHCHVGFSARRVRDEVRRFSFEPAGAPSRPELDSYFSPRLMRKWHKVFRWRFVQQAMQIHWTGQAGDALDDQIHAFNRRHCDLAESIDRIVLLAFDEHHRDDGTPSAAASHRRDCAGDLYVSNSLVAHLCAEQPQRYWFGASVHPYRKFDGRPAESALSELREAGAVLVKWLPIHHNIDVEDPRSVAFLRRAAELDLTMLIHYGGESTLAPQHPQYEYPHGLLNVLRDLKREGRMPRTIVAHLATPSMPWQSSRGHRMLIDAMLGEFRNDPLYSDISGMASPGRFTRLGQAARHKALHDKIVWATDFPIPVFPFLMRGRLRRKMKALAECPSWIERNYQMMKALGFDESIFHRAGEILKPR